LPEFTTINLIWLWLGGRFRQSSPAPRLLVAEEGRSLLPMATAAFDEHGQGKIGSSAMGLRSQKRLAEAVADGDKAAVIKGIAINNDGSSKVTSGQI